MVRKEKQMSAMTDQQTDGRADIEAVVAEQVETAIGDSPSAAETQTADALRWFEMVDVPQADFKAFVRLPNDYQHKDIREKAMAAKARRIRTLRNVSTDAWEVLEFEMESIAEAEGAAENLVHELLMDREPRDRYEAIQEVNEREEYKHVAKDQERFRSLQGMTSDERPEDEWVELVEHLAKYARDIQAEVEKMQAPRKAALSAMDVNELVDKVRERRIDTEGRRAFNDTYAFWQTYVGTLEIPEGFDPDHITRPTMPRVRVFKDESELREIDPLIGVRLAEAFERLENALMSLTAGNS
jgi:hypothetical protein